MARVRTDGMFSEEIDVTLGLLQGEILSPFLFSLHLSDIEMFFRSQNVGGIRIDDFCDILLLLYADDLINFADSYTDAKNKLNILI